MTGTHNVGIQCRNQIKPISCVYYIDSQIIRAVTLANIYVEFPKRLVIRNLYSCKDKFVAPQNEQPTRYNSSH